MSIIMIQIGKFIHKKMYTVFLSITGFKPQNYEKMPHIF